MADENTETCEDEQNTTITTKSLVTPEQILNASVNRKRRNITKKRSQSSGSNTRIVTRDKTPIRETKPPTEDVEAVEDDQCNRLLLDDSSTDKESIEKSTENDEKSKENDEKSKENENSVSVRPARPTRRRSREINKTDLKNDNQQLNKNETQQNNHQNSSIAEKSLQKKEPSSDVLQLLNTAKRSLSQSKADSRSRKPTVEKKAIIKRSQSTPREIITFDDADLIESFKKAQRLSAEVGTSKLGYPSSISSSSSRETLSTEHNSEEDEQTRLENKLKLLQQQSELKEKLKLIKQAQSEKQSLQDQTQSIQGTDKTQKRKIFRNFIKEAWSTWKEFLIDNQDDYRIINSLRNRCLGHIMTMLILCGLGAFIFRFTEGAFENFYKCGVKRVKRDFIDTLWLSSHNLREDDWKSLARRKLMDFEEQLHTAHEAGMHSYSGQRSWSFLNSIVYCLTIVTTIGYGHITPATTTGRAITIIYAIFGIPMFLILLADFGKLFTRCIKFVWAFVRRLYYTGSCRKVRKNENLQDVMKGVQMVYEIATFRRPSQLNTPNTPGGENTPCTPAPSNFAVDDEFNLPVSVAIFILLLYIVCGALIYWMWENWSFFESFYFVFISMSTIGFGDFVPQHPMYMMASILYLVFGLALTSMCINVVQVKLSDTFRQASAKIGATIGLAMAEDDGSITQQPQTELAEVHTAAKKETKFDS
ncbi:uncharacterized protein LOC123290922 isoform X1 [Chrysoperla carnea]|uniref:uncharacterized protein LOC123290922 isoform X1 n=1 Tax=Chrysoperla carnea TaxID=189513 RepID=UPI001D07941D|nr:uncharacterized protein LOC123290922 isoform X1 [Chrysoperla carnea]